MNPYTQVTFLKSAAKLEQAPSDLGYEVAFVGRSNSGKSSALNTLVGRQIARTSKTPGRTRLINFFTLLDPQYRLVDLPGYGYAKVSKQLQHEWQIQLTHYLSKRKSLSGLIVLMDIRHPLTPLDQTLIDWALTQEFNIHILLTKSDKLGRGAMQNTILQVRKKYELMSDTLSVQAFSALKKQGIDTLIEVLNKWLEI